jgi:mycothiol S-conjugate amidase
VRHEWLGFVDSGFPEGDPPAPPPEGSFATLPVEQGAAPLVGLMRRFRPHVVTTYDEKGGYPHPDHVMCHRVSDHAFDAAGDPDRYPDEGEPWQPLKLYYQLTFHKQRVQALHDAVQAADLPSPYEKWLAEWIDRPEDSDRLTTMVPCADYFAMRDRGLLAHATQVDPDGRWFSVPLEVQQAAWPTEDYQLARCTVATELPEDDLFAGLRAAATKEVAGP